MAAAVNGFGLDIRLNDNMADFSGTNNLRFYFFIGITRADSRSPRNSGNTVVFPACSK